MKRKILGMMGKMEVLVRETDSVGVIELAGEIDIYNCHEIKKLVDAYINRNIKNIIVDMGKVSYIDSSTIGVLLSELKRLQALEGGLKLLNLTGAPRTVFKMARLENLFDIYENESDALGAFAEKQQ